MSFEYEFKPEESNDFTRAARSRGRRMTRALFQDFIGAVLTRSTTQEDGGLQILVNVAVILVHILVNRIFVLSVSALRSDPIHEGVLTRSTAQGDRRIMRMCRLASQ